MPSRTDIYKVSMTTPSRTRFTEAKKTYKQKSFEALFNMLLDEHEKRGGKDAK